MLCQWGLLYGSSERSFVLCSVVVASLVSVTGIIGFVVTYHTTISSGCRLVPAITLWFWPCAVLGGIFLIWADAAARLFGGAELTIGIITAFIGAPFFMYLMIRKNYGVENEN